MVWRLLEVRQCEQREIMNDHDFAHPTVSTITVEVKSPTITLPECVRRKFNALLLLGFGSGGLRKQAASAFTTASTRSADF